MQHDTPTGSRDLESINVHEDFELSDRCDALGVTPDQLRAAVQIVGNNLQNVRRQLQRRTVLGER